MKIIPVQKLQEGGSMFTQYKPFPRLSETQQTTAAPQTTGAAEKSNEVIDEYTKKQLIEKGLPNEVDQFLIGVNSLYKNPFGRTNATTVARQQNQLISQLNRISFNKETYDDAVKSAAENKALNEVVVNDRGEVLSYNKNGELENINLKNYDPSKNRLITVSEFASLRANDPSLANNVSSLSLIKGSIGREVILDKVTNYISKLQSDSIHNERYLSSSKKEDLQTLKELTSLDDGIYKQSLAETGLSNEKVKKAVSNIYKSLDTKEKTILDAVAVQNGLSVQNGALQIILDNITTNTGSKKETTLDLDTAAMKAAGAGSEKDSGAMTKTSQAMAALNGESTVDRALSIDLGDGTMIQTPNAKWFSSLQDQDNKTILGGSLTNVIQKSWLSQAGDPGSVYFGKQKLDAGAMSKIAYNHEAGMSQAFLPFTTDSTGGYKVNYEVLDKLNKARKEVKSRNLKLPQDIMEIYNKHGVKQYYKAESDPNYAAQHNLLRPFFLFNAIATDDIVDPKKSGSEVVKASHIPWGDSDSYKRAESSYMYSLTDGDEDKFNDITKLHSGISADILKGVVTIPWSGDYLSTAAGAGVLQQFKYNYNIDYLTTEGKIKNKSFDPVINNFSSQK